MLPPLAEGAGIIGNDLRFAGLQDRVGANFCNPSAPDVDSFSSKVLVGKIWFGISFLMLKSLYGSITAGKSWDDEQSAWLEQRFGFERLQSDGRVYILSKQEVVLCYTTLLMINHICLLLKFIVRYLKPLFLNALMLS